MNSNPLSNPIWHALTSGHQSFAIGNDLARRYPPEVSPLAGMIDFSQASWNALADITPVGESVFLATEASINPPDIWEIKFLKQIDQMVCENFCPQTIPDGLMTPLTDNDVPEMLALTKLTKPGPFEPKTHTMGNYLGIWQDGRLAAMSGERMKLNGYTEVSAVCTHPDFRGRGYAKLLVSAITEKIIARNVTPILHTLSDNPPAIKVYQSLGFKKSREVYFAVLKRAR